MPGSPTVIAVLSACLMLAGSWGAVAAGLTGEERTTFVSSSLSACVRTASANNPSFTGTQIKDYCSCYSEMMADTITGEELRKLEASTIMTALADRIQAAANFCVAKTLPR